MSKISDGDALAADPHSTTKDSPAAHQVYIYVVCVVYVCVCLCVCVFVLFKARTNPYKDAASCSMYACSCHYVCPRTTIVLILRHISSACQCLFICVLIVLYMRMKHARFKRQ